MKFYKPLFLMCSLFLATGCGTKTGAKLSLDNAKDYLQPLVENEGNASFDEKRITFGIYPNNAKGKLFSSDIKGKCNVSVKYMTGLSSDFKFIWSDPYEIKDVEFAYKEGAKSGDSQQVDYLQASFEYNVDFKFSTVNVFNLQVTEISGHMLP